MLVAQSDIHRQEILLHVAEMEHSVAQFKKRFAIFGISSVALSAGATLAGLFFGRRKHTIEGGGNNSIFSKIFSGISAFNQIKSVFNRFRSASSETSES